MNDISFEQGSAILNAIHAQLTGTNSITPVDTTEWTQQAQTVLKTGTEPIMNALSAVMNRTIWSVRPYYARLTGLRRDAHRWGGHIRKIVVVDKPYVDDASINLVDGQSIDMYKVRKPEPLQTNFYGQVKYADFITIFVDQIDIALSGPEEWQSFLGMVFQNIEDKKEMKHDETSLLTIANMCGAKVLADSDNVINLLSQYYLETGTYLVNDITDTRYYKAKANIDDFSKWAIGFINNISKKMRNRSVKFHKNIASKNIPRHTPFADQHMYLLTPEIEGVKTRVLSSAFNPDMLKVGDFEEIDFWQSIDKPEEIQVKPNYIDNDGKVVEATEAVTISNLFGILFDTEAMGIRVVNEFAGVTPLNVIGKYTNYAWSWTEEYYNDMTENMVMFTLNQTEADPTVMNISPTTLSIAKGATGTINVNYPQSTVTATSSASATGVTVAYSNGKAVVTVAADASAESSTITITDGTTTLTCAVTVTEAPANNTRKK